MKNGQSGSEKRRQRDRAGTSPDASEGDTGVY